MHIHLRKGEGLFNKSINSNEFGVSQKIRGTPDGAAVFKIGDKNQ